MVGAAIVAVWIFYVVNNPSLFTASVLSLQEKNFIVEKWRDIAYKTDSWYMDIFMSQNMPTPASIDFTIIFDKDSVTIDPQNLSGQWTRTISSQSADNMSIQSEPGSNVDKNQSIIVLPFTGNLKNILLSEAKVKWGKSLSIWSLNDITSHSTN